MGARTVSSDEEEFEEREDDIRDNEAAVEDEEDEDEEDEEGQDEYEKDDFIVDDVEEEEEQKESSDEESKAKKRKRKKREAEGQYELDEDDYELLQEAHGTGFHRPKSASTTKFKRLKKAGRVAGEDSASAQRGFSDDEDLEEGSLRGRTAEEELKRSLFGDDEGAPPEDLGEEEEQEEEEEDIGDEDEMADFIVDEEEMDENGQPVRRRRKAKKRGPRQATGISSIALQEAQEIFGDVEELLNRRKLGLRADRGEDDGEMDEDEGGLRRPSKKKLEEEFEPSILEEKYMTAKDDRIRETDMPERLQLLEEMTGLVPPKETKIKEAEWIYNRAFGTLAVPMRKEFRYLVKMEKTQIVQQISYVLTQLHDNKLEITFIGMYRKEGCLDLVREPIEEPVNVQDGEKQPKEKGKEKEKVKVKVNHYKALWEVQHWDRKWWLLQRRKGALQSTFEKRARAEALNDPTKHEILDKLLACLRDAESEQAVDDVDAKFHLFFPPDEVEAEQGQFKRPKLRSFYAVCRKAGLRTITKHFGLTAEQFGENLQAMYKRHEVDDSSAAPEDIAKEFSAVGFNDPQSVLQGARHMASVEISTEPVVREYVRNMYMERATVTTKPTTEGNAVIDSFHEYASVKWLLNKPVNAFDDAQWLLIQKADEDKLLEVTVGLPKEVVTDSLMQEFETLYLSDGVSRTAQLWNEQRTQILKEAVSTFLLPLLEKEARMLLIIRAKNWVARECGAELWKKVSVASHPRPKSDPDERLEEDGAPRVMACCWGHGNPATTFVVLDPSGEIVNTLYTPYLNSNLIHEHIQKKKNDQQRLLKFMMENQPHVVVLGAASLACRQLKDDIYEAIFKIVEEHPRDLAEGIDMINVVYGDEALPNLYEHSRVSLEQLPGQPGIVRRAVALGRYLQNPLAMVASLCGPKREVLSLKIHKMQQFLSADELFDAIVQVMITVTNQVGVDVNLAAAHEWLFAPLQFVSGLGPRKASMMQRLIQGAGRIATRKEMLTSLRLMKKNVFINACGFLRVRGSGQAASGNQILDPLDDTRIHPESYDLAKKMAEDVYCEDQRQNREDMDEEMLEMAIEHVKENPNLIKNLDIVEYAGIVQDRDGVYKLETLKDIQMELLYGYKDWRVPYLQPSQDEEFSLLTGEDDDTLAEGRIVNATVRKVQNNRVMCVLESGLLGVIQKEDLSDDRDFDPLDKVSRGTIISCRVKNLQKAKYLVDLTCRGSELRADRWENRRTKDQYYVQDDSLLHNEQDKTKKEREEEKSKSFKPRMIVHPQFQNISMAEAIEALKDKDAGDCIIRPSSKGPSHLYLTLKIFDQVYSHIDIVEGGKDSKDFTSFLRLGKTLKIGDETFEDLDEVIARYVDPLVGNLKALLTYRKFRAGTKSQVDDSLKQERLQYPNRICYCFSVSYDHPGAFVLSYVRNVNIHHEYISLYPKGFKFRKRMFEKLDKLVFFFSKHINDPIIDNPPHRAVAAMVPMRSPAPGGLGSGMWDGSDRPSSAASTGWGGDANRGAGSDRASTPGSRSIGNWGATVSKSGGHGALTTEGRGRLPKGGIDEDRGRSVERWGRDSSGEGRGQAWGQITEARIDADPGWGRAKEGSGGIGSDDGWGSWTVGKDRSADGPESGSGVPTGLESGWGVSSSGKESGSGLNADPGKEIDGWVSVGNPGKESGRWDSSHYGKVSNIAQGSGTVLDQMGFRSGPSAGHDSWHVDRGWARTKESTGDGSTDVGWGSWTAGKDRKSDTGPEFGWNVRSGLERGGWGVGISGKEGGGLDAGSIKESSLWGNIGNIGKDIGGWGASHIGKGSSIVEGSGHLLDQSNFRSGGRGNWNADIRGSYGALGRGYTGDVRGLAVRNSGGLWSRGRLGHDGGRGASQSWGRDQRDFGGSSNWVGGDNNLTENGGLPKEGLRDGVWGGAAPGKDVSDGGQGSWNRPSNIGGWDLLNDNSSWDMPKERLDDGWATAKASGSGWS